MAFDSLAQLAEHLTFNQGVRGSNPRWITKTPETLSFRGFSYVYTKKSVLLIFDIKNKNQGDKKNG